MDTNLYPVLFNKSNNREEKLTFYEFNILNNIQKIYKIRSKFLNKLPNELVEYIFEKYLNFNCNFKMSLDIYKYKNLKFKPNDFTFLPFLKLDKPNYKCNKKLHVKNDHYITCYSTHQELCTESFHNMLIATELNKFESCLNLASRKINKDNLTNLLENLINERNKLLTNINYETT